jgi:signal transduction histidine kinase
MSTAERILFVDDDPNLLEACERVLRKRFQIDARVGPAAGLAAIEREGPYAVVVSDMRMPEMDGVQFLAQVKARVPDTVRMMLTAFPDMQTAVEAVNQGHIFRFLTKPCTSEHLTTALEAGLEQHRLVKSRREMLELQLRHAQKMELVGQCAAGVAHDLNNILGIIQACAWRASKPETDPAALAQFLEHIQEAAQNATQLTRQLVSFSRRQERVQFGPVDVSRLLQELTPLLRHLLPKGITVRCEAPAGLERVHGDAHMLGQVVMNLALNARDAMPKGGELRVQAELRVVTAHHPTRHPDLRLGRFVCLSVRDTGSGMDTVIRRRIFEPFFTTKAEGQGTGLGLAVVTDVVKQHHGWVEVSSQAGQGATFDVYLPVAAGQAQPQREGSP